MKSHFSRGFTLIELLVVIAIIGILSAVVLASLNTARSKGNDAAVKANLNTVGTQAALYLSDNNDYGTFNSGNTGTCPTVDVTGDTVFNDPTIEKAIAAALVNSPGGVTACHSNGAAYAVAVSRPAGSASAYWCIDSTGTHCGINSFLLPGAACTATVCASIQ
ncbi:MAG: type II secretion system protein [Candidatus Kaiserbacteria bacterium]|nr:type II secretion system protein [Candidatus Kaiserbacteria bacterium]